MLTFRVGSKGRFFEQELFFETFLTCLSEMLNVFESGITEKSYLKEIQKSKNIASSMNTFCHKPIYQKFCALFWQ